MRFTKALIGVVLLLPLLFLTGGCGRERSASRNAQAYGRLTASVVRLYSQIQPLRSARLGITSSDSLLFTFSDDEIKRSLKRLKRLESQFSAFPASELPERDIDQATVVIHWLRGEIFAFETAESHRYGPLLYCWTAEEALWEMPARFTPPYAGELAAYRSRILRIPLLLSNGARHLNNPAEAHVRYAIERLDTLAGGIGDLQVLIEKRYGASLDQELALVRKSLVDFREFLTGLLPASHGALILGAENLSKLFLYDELLDSDPNMMMAEAASQIKRLKNEMGPTERHIEFEKRQFPPPALVTGSLESRIEHLSSVLWTANGKGAGIGAKDTMPPTLEYPARTEYLSLLNKDPYLSMPPVGDRIAAAAFTLPFSAPACRPCLALSSENANADDAELSFRLLSAAPEILKPGEMRCQKGDTLGALFLSETFEEGWRYLVLLERARDVKKDAALYRLLINERVRQFARMVVVFKLHTGASTSDEAVQYLVETTGMERNAASREVLLASISPAIAYPGISMILVEEMLKNAAYLYGNSNPTRDLKKLLLESRDIPLALILPKTKSD